MADERNEWLDHEAAERLLRGEPVDADDDYTRLRAERLAEALESVRAANGPLSAGPSGELPGEEAALTAFRAARSERAARPQVARAGSDLGSVRIGAALRPPRWARPARWVRPARWGLAASVAGLAVGGVAVAAGTGVLPAFGGDNGPAPVASAAVPSELNAPESPAVTPRGSHGPSAPTHPGMHPSGSPVPSTGADGAVTSGSDGSYDNDGASGGRTDGGAWGRDATQAPDGTWPDRTTQACRDFRDGRLDSARRQRLEVAAKADGGVQRFCDQVLAGGGRQSGGGSSAGTGADTGTGTGSTGGGDRDRDSGDADSDRDTGRGGGDRNGGGTGGTGDRKPGDGDKASGADASGSTAGTDGTGGTVGSASATSWTAPVTSASGLAV
ncbi:hypothetical protein [Streptomyces sp. TRM49041]|uniref:hypothetical protein n=1 Tax=Streptomyces sp. TRM49041 TaxID=2603216 RepID=UPI0011EFD253|nr:hypothetical protein [Streptomyces sp. TRM49041]